MLERLAREVANLRGRVSRLESIPVPRRYPSLFPMATYTLPNGITANGVVFRGTLEPGGAKLVRWVQTWRVDTLNNTTNYWAILLRREPSAMTLASFSTADSGVNTWVRTDLDNLAATVADSDVALYVIVIRVGAPGALSLANPLVWLE